MAWRYALGGTTASIGAVVAGAVYERPFADVKDGVWVATRGVVIRTEGPPRSASALGLDTHRRVVDDDASFSAVGDGGSYRPLSSVLARLCTNVVVPGAAVLSRAALRVMNRLEVVEDGNYERFVEEVERRRSRLFSELSRGGDARAREEARAPGLVTVCNHASVFDDPPLMSALLPARLAFDGGAQRLAACSQEVCFSRGKLVSGLVAAGRVVPIKRGGGLEQRGLDALQASVDAGGWVHLFPEGHVFQSGTLGRDHADCAAGVERREADRETRGVLKWGVGKLIAHAKRPPVVLPFAHDGMQHIMPFATTGTRVTVPALPRAGNAVRVAFGDPLTFHDLITAHERRHGSIHAPNDRHAELYSAITRRIEGSLADLLRTAQLGGRDGPRGSPDAV